MATVKRPASNVGDASKVVRLLSKLYGSAPSNTDIQELRRHNLGLDRFDWMLLVISLEIDLKVRIPQRLVEPRAQTIAQFAKSVAALPKVKSEEHTLEALRLLASALLDAGESPSAPRTVRKKAR